MKSNGKGSGKLTSTKVQNVKSGRTLGKADSGGKSPKGGKKSSY